MIFHVRVDAAYSHPFAGMTLQCDASPSRQYISLFDPLVRPTTSIHEEAFVAVRFVTIPLRVVALAQIVTTGARDEVLVDEVPVDHPPPGEVPIVIVSVRDVELHDVYLRVHVPTWEAILAGIVMVYHAPLGLVAVPTYRTVAPLPFVQEIVGAESVQLGSVLQSSEVISEFLVENEVFGRVYRQLEVLHVVVPVFVVGDVYVIVSVSVFGEHEEV